MSNRSSFSSESLKNAPKSELYAYFKDCSNLDDGEMRRVIAEITSRLTEKTTRVDKLMFVLLACSQDFKQINFGMGMIEDFINEEEAMQYWMAVYTWAIAPENSRNIAQMRAESKIRKLHGGNPSYEELEDVIAEMETVHQGFINLVGQFKNKTSPETSTQE